MDLKTLTDLYPSHKLIVGEQFAQESITALKVRSILRWSDTIFVKCDFSEAHMHLLIMTDAIFFECDFSGAKLTACDVDGSEFINCNLTCTDFRGSSVKDTTFSDCIIGGMAGPIEAASCTFNNPRYSRQLAIASHAPYFILTVAEGPLYAFRTPVDWRLHTGLGRQVITLDAEAPEPYKSIIRAFEALEENASKAVELA